MDLQFSNFPDWIDQPNTHAKQSARVLDTSSTTTAEAKYGIQRHSDDTAMHFARCADWHFEIAMASGKELPVPLESLMDHEWTTWTVVR